MNKASYFLFLLICLSSITSLSAQDNNYYKESKQVSAKTFSRLVWNPKINIYFPFLDQQFDANDEKINIEYNNGVLIGARFERYFPNRRIDFGAEIDYQNRRLGYSHDNTRYQSFDQGFSIMPTISFKKGKYDKTKHFFQEIGLRNQIIIGNNSEIGFLNQGGGINNSSEKILKTYKLSGYIGIGFKNDIFNHLGTATKKGMNNPPNVGLRNLSIGIHFPLFNQGNTFKNRNTNFDAPFELFKKNYTRSLFFTINYSDQIDYKKNREEAPYTIPFITDDTFVDTYLPPIGNTDLNKKNYSGNFYMHLNYQPKVDSVFFTGGRMKEGLIDVKPTISYNIGYTFHFLGNYKKFFVVNEDENRITPVSITGEGSHRFNFFISAGINDQWYEFKGSKSGRANYLTFETSGGFRRSGPKQRVFLFGGYTYRLILKKNLYINEFDFLDFTVGTYAKSNYFLGLSLKSFLSLKISYRDILTERSEEKLLDKFGFTIGIGI